MSKIKKVLAVFLTLAMVLGMGMTTFAAPEDYTSNIIVTNLSEKDSSTTVKIYKAVSLVEENGEQKWVVADWAKDYITLSDDETKYEITDAVNLGKAAEEKGEVLETKTAENQTVTFENYEVGAYVIIASGDHTQYATMVANTYDDSQTYMAAKDATVVAKSSGYIVDKTADDNFVAKGSTVHFTIRTTFPNFENVSADNSYKIVDTPSKLTITGIDTATVGGVNVKDQVTGAYNVDNTQYTMDFSALIGNTDETLNANAGKEVVITYSATVDTEDGYSNTANAFRNETTIGEDNEQGYSADLTVTKVDAKDQGKTLTGAKFEVYASAKEDVKDSSIPLSFIKDETSGAYILTEAGTSGAVTEIEVDANGKVQVKGLAEGTYWFKETVAPKGYSINEEGVEFTVSDKNEDAEPVTQNVSLSSKLVDTKLSSLPSTGGIGTTIFTIGGCLIMIIAAALFFASRRKENK